MKYRIRLGEGGLECTDPAEDDEDYSENEVNLILTQPLLPHLSSM